LEQVAGSLAVFGFAINGLTEICHDVGLKSPVWAWQSAQIDDLAY